MCNNGANPHATETHLINDAKPQHRMNARCSKPAVSQHRTSVLGPTSQSSRSIPNGDNGQASAIHACKANHHGQLAGVRQNKTSFVQTTPSRYEQAFLGESDLVCNSSTHIFLNSGRQNAPVTFGRWISLRRGEWWCMSFTYPLYFMSSYFWYFFVFLVGVSPGIFLGDFFCISCAPISCFLVSV